MIAHTEKWAPAVGERVAVIYGRRHDPDRVEFHMVTKVGKRDVVLDNGDRFNVNSLTRRRRDTWDPDDRLLPQESPVAAQKINEQRRYNHGRVLRRLLDNAAQAASAAAQAWRSEDDYRAALAECHELLIEAGDRLARMRGEQ